MLMVGFYFLRSNKSIDDYYVGGRTMSSWHIGLSVVATDVGGGFSIGLGGLGFTMGLAGSWMLFTGLIGAWLAAVFLIPRLFEIPEFKKLYTFPQIFGLFYDRRTALLAGIISGIGYIGFTSSQLLAGAKLASATFEDLTLNYALIIMGVTAVVYTVLGGIKAVIYTDTIQWIILLSGLIFIGIPMGYNAIGGWSSIKETLDPSFYSLSNINAIDLLNWAVTIIPIWFVGMTLYQRIYSSKNVREAKKAWFIAGFFEWPVMAFLGVILGLFSRVAIDQGVLEVGSIAAFDPEQGLPMFLREILPFGILGLMMSAYFSAILSTADSCLMAASGNLVTDILGVNSDSKKNFLRYSQVSTLVLGVFALTLATFMTSVLNLMLYSYAFMVSGLFVPVLMAFFSKKQDSTAAFFSMLAGGGTTLILQLLGVELSFGLDANIYGITFSFLVYLIIKHSKLNFIKRKNTKYA